MKYFNMLNKKSEIKNNITERQHLKLLNPRCIKPEKIKNKGHFKLLNESAFVKGGK